MESQPNTLMSRRKFLRLFGSLAAGSTLVGCAPPVIQISDSGRTAISAGEPVTPLARAAPVNPIDCFTAILYEPSDYSKVLPDFCNAYICASMAKLARKEAVGAAHTDEKYKEAVHTTLTKWGLDGADKTIFINSREIQDQRPGTQGLILFHRQTAFVIFRSTERKFSDWMTNLNVRKKPSPCGKGNIHAGFLDAFNAVVPEKGEALSTFEEVVDQLLSMKAVWITGHSLGGALAAVATSCLLQTGIIVAGLYTFGAPRVGDPEYRDYMNQRLTYKYWRFMHKQDLVPDIPLPRLLPNLPIRLVTGFSREGNMLRLLDKGYQVLRRVDRDGERTVLGTYNGTSAQDHGIDSYRARLLDLVHQEIPEFPEMNYMNVPGDIELDTTNEDIKAIENFDCDTKLCE
jgi:hypothetical protein